MRTRSRLRISLALPGALVLSMLLAGQSVAASTWADPVRIASGGAWLSDVLTLGRSTAIVVYEKCIGSAWCSEVSVLKRSTDGGVTWGERKVVEGDMAAIAGRGPKVDLAWRQQNGETRYARSGNRGKSFLASRTLSSSDGSSRMPSVARGPDGLVAVGWGEWPELAEQATVRVSTDGGTTFGSATSWPTAEMDTVEVAVGSGVVYAVYENAKGALVVRRSVDGGSSWSKATIIAETTHAYSVAADGNNAYIAYETYSRKGRSSVVTRRTMDQGAHWSAPRQLSPSSWNSRFPDMEFRAGLLRAAFTRIVDTAGCAGDDEGRHFYTESVDADTWTTPERVSPAECPSYADVGFAGRRLVAWDDGVRLYVRTQAP